MLLDGVRFTASNRRSLMGDNGTTSLLILQDREMNLERIERSLESLPRERESIQKKIAAFDSEIEEGKQRIKEMEVRGKAMQRHRLEDRHRWRLVFLALSSGR